jgi:16S rRNA (guanine527-N7)-methyltransferase
VNSAEFQERLLSQAGVAGVNLSHAEVSRLEVYFRLLSHWNRRINLTALQLEPASDEAIDRLLVEPLAAAPYVQDSPLDWFDLGSGGGSPAFPLKIVRPEAKLILVEARSRKAAFLREVARELEFPDVEVINDRLETVSARPELAGAADLITVRAVRVDTASGTAAGLLLRSDGRLLLFSKSSLTSDLQMPGFVKILMAELILYRDSQLVVLKKANIF